MSVERTPKPEEKQEARSRAAPTLQASGAPATQGKGCEVRYWTKITKLETNEHTQKSQQHGMFKYQVSDLHPRIPMMEFYMVQRTCPSPSVGSNKPGPQTLEGKQHMCVFFICLFVCF